MPTPHEDLWLFLDFLFDWLGPYRRLRGGDWVYVNEIHPTLGYHIRGWCRAPE